MQNINWKIVLLSCILSAFLLFGGWFLYAYFQQDRPIYFWFEQHQTVELVELNEGKNGIDVVVRFHDPDRFDQDYHNLSRFLNQLTDKYQIVIVPEQSIFHPFWRKHGTQFVQFIEQKEYGHLNRYIDQLKNSQEIVDGYATITEEGILIYIDVADQDDVYLRFPISLWRGGETVEG